MKNEDFSDNDTLIASLKNGEEKAYVYLVDTYHNKLCIYANSLIKNVYSAEDIVQNVFIKVWKQRTRLKADHSLKSFLYKSVYNEFIDLYRKNQSLLSIEKSYYEALDAIVLEEDSESIQRMMQIINAEIDNLPQKCKLVFNLSKKEGLTNIEIAEHLEVSIKTVEAQITKAFSILRSSLEIKPKGFLFLLFKMEFLEKLETKIP